VPRTGENALLKLAPALSRLASQAPSYEMTDVPTAFLEGLGEDPGDPAAALSKLGATDPALLTLVEPMFGVTLAPTMAHASDKINVIPSRAYLKVDCRVPPGLGAEAARRRIADVLGDEAANVDIEFTEQVAGNQSPVSSELSEAIDRWVRANDPDAGTVPVILPGFSDSRWFRDAFPDCIAYGFFPQRHMSLSETGPLVHNADERIDIRDLGYAAGFYADIARELLG
jgi:acetylornithine deacetylase/succinyl-diaminopimelate desuccinylase-like protein